MTNKEIKSRLKNLYDSETDFAVARTDKESNKTNGLQYPKSCEIMLHGKNFKTDNKPMYTAK